MKNLSKKTTALAILLSLVIIGVSQPYNGNRGNQSQNQQKCVKSPEHRGERMAELLDLTDQQKEQFKALRLDHQKAMLPMKNELNELNAKLKTLSTAENADMKAINSQIDKIGSLKTKMMKSKAAHKQEMRKILTEEQRIMFDSHKGRKGKACGYGHGRGQGKGYGKI